MSIFGTLKDMLVPDTDRGVVYRCAECGETFETARERCPDCGSEEIEEAEGFDMRPDP